MPGVTAAASPLQALRERRYQIAPQMKDYDLLGQKRWLPYVMFFQPPGLKTRSFTTDEQGFRRTLDRGNSVSYSEFNRSSRPRAILLGASAAFGVGASSDRSTLASLLNDGSERLWFNYSGRAFNSTQELILFLLYLQEPVESVLLFSGVNHLVLSHLAQETSPVYNSFFFQSLFERGMNADLAVRRGGLRRLLKGEFLRPPAEGPAPTPSSDSERYENALACFRRDMRIWGLLREAMGFQIRFVFQPVLPWVGKELSGQERELFDLVDKIFPEESANGFMEFLMGKKDRFVADVESICRSQKIPFLDLNTRPSFTRPDWLFVDRIHLTDEGYALARQEIRKEFAL